MAAFWGAGRRGLAGTGGRAAAPVARAGGGGEGLTSCCIRHRLRTRGRASRASRNPQTPLTPPPHPPTPPQEMRAQPPQTPQTTPTPTPTQPPQPGGDDTHTQPSPAPPPDRGGHAVPPRRVPPHDHPPRPQTGQRPAHGGAAAQRHGALRLHARALARAPVGRGFGWFGGPSALCGQSRSCTKQPPARPL
jgi:hypothetical protein